MSMILNLCHGCGITLDANVERCENCGVGKDDETAGWIVAKLSDDDGERLAAKTGLMLAYGDPDNAE